MPPGSVQLANGAQCLCGNNDAVKFRHYKDNDEILGAYCLKCKGEYLQESFLLGDVATDQRNAELELGMKKLYRRAEIIDQTDSGVHMVHPQKTKIEDRNGKDLKPGDHIAWERPYIIWHHALVTAIDPVSGKVQVIHWHKDMEKNCKILEEWIDLDKQLGTLYRIEYDEDLSKMNPTPLVLARARSRKGDNGYSFFGDNCEAFATFCKRGVEKSQQVVHLMKGIGDRVKVALADLPVRAVEQGIRIAQAAFVQNLEVVTAETIEMITQTCQWVGMGLVVFMEGCLTIYDLHVLYESRKKGDLTRKQFLEQASKRVTETILTAVPAALGGFVPVVGIFVGMIGATVGKLAGAWIGPYVGKVLTNMIRPDDRAVQSINDLHLGDHIVFYGNFAHPRHHVIVLWHDEKNTSVNVIHNTYESGVKQEWIKFKAPFYKVIYRDDQCLPADKVCNRAILKLGTYEYNLLTYNCKHFAEWCKKK